MTVAEKKGGKAVSGRPKTVTGEIMDDAVRFAKGYAAGLVEEGKGRIRNYFKELFGLGFDDPETRERMEYKGFKELVRRALDGDDFGLDIYEVPGERLERKNALGMWEGREIKIPRLKDIPKMLGGAYETIKQNSDRRKALDGQVQDYIKLHEKIEAVKRPAKEEHELYEATLLKSLSDLANEGNEKARKVYEGAMAAYKVRMVGGDRFARDVQRYYTQLEEDVRSAFSLEDMKKINLN